MNVPMGDSPTMAGALGRLRPSATSRWCTGCSRSDSRLRPQLKLDGGGDPNWLTAHRVFCKCSPMHGSDDDGSEHTLGLLLDLREVCLRIAENHDKYAADLHQLLREVQNPNLHDLDGELSF